MPLIQSEEWRTALNKRNSLIRFVIAAVFFIAVMLCCALAGAETAKDITSSCKFYAGSGRTGDNAFAKCTNLTEVSIPVPTLMTVSSLSSSFAAAAKASTTSST